MQTFSVCSELLGFNGSCAQAMSAERGCGAWWGLPSGSDWPTKHWQLMQVLMSAIGLFSRTASVSSAPFLLRVLQMLFGDLWRASILWTSIYTNIAPLFFVFLYATTVKITGKKNSGHVEKMVMSTCRSFFSCAQIGHHNVCKDSMSLSCWFYVVCNK